MANPKRPFKTTEEQKNIDLDQGSQIVNGLTAVKTLINPCFYGTGTQQHVGRRINLSSIQYRFVGTTNVTLTEVCW